jgi:hypothetical protein
MVLWEPMALMFRYTCPRAESYGPVASRALFKATVNSLQAKVEGFWSLGALYALGGA